MKGRKSLRRGRKGILTFYLPLGFLVVFACSRYRFRGRAAIMASSLLIYMFPPVLLLVPLFTIMRGLGLLNKR